MNDKPFSYTSHNGTTFESTIVETTNKEFSYGSEEVEMTAHESFGDLMTIQEYIEAEDFLEGNGIGYYATATQESNIHSFRVRPSWATHVMWYNK